MTDSPLQFRNKCFKAASTLQTDSKAIVTEIALAAKTDQMTAARAAGVGERLRGVGKRGAKVSVGFETIGNFANPAAIVKWRGPIQLVNDPTSSHIETPRKRRGAKATLKLPDGFRREIHHPGTTGKHFFEAGVEVTKAKAPAVLKRGTHRALAKHFTGD